MEQKVQVKDVPAGIPYKNCPTGNTYVRMDRPSIPGSCGNQDQLWILNLDTKSQYTVPANKMVIVDKPIDDNARWFKFWMCMVDGGGSPIVRHLREDDAIGEAKRLAGKTLSSVYILEATQIVRVETAVFRDNLKPRS